MNLRLTPILLVACGIAAVAWFTGGFYCLTNVCTDCGAIQDVRRIMWISSADVHETPLSLHLESLRHGIPRSHDWMLVSGSGGLIRCALGGGGNIAQASRSREIVEALIAIRKHRGDAEADRWIKRIFDRKTTTCARLALYILGEDPGDFETDFATAEEEFKEYQASYPP